MHRETTTARGTRAEAAAVAYLTAQQLQVLSRNVRVGRLEIDIVVRDGPVVAIVEVRTRGRGAWASAFESVDYGKRRRLRRAAHLLWSRRYRRMPGIERMRFDIAAVDLSVTPPLVEHVMAAF